MTEAMALPRWDLSSFFPSFEGPERTEFEASLSAELARAIEHASGIEPLERNTEAAWESVVVTHEGLAARLSHLAAYVGCLASADGLDERYSLAESRLNLARASFEKLD